MISRRAFTAGLCSCALGSLTGCATHHDSGPVTGLPDVPVHFRPDPKTDEAGLWMQLDKEESKLKIAQSRIRDKTINDFVSDVMCRLVTGHCPDLRTYVMRVPMFNATCAPNGMVQVYSGLLLRAGSESQLASVLGHEFGHYLKRHTLQQMRDGREWDDSMALFSLGANGPMAADMQRLSAIIARLSRMAFSRDHEREADEIGFDLMVKAGYDPFAAAGMWKRVTEELKAGDIDEDFDVFTATHPATKDRIEDLTKLAEKHSRGGRPAPNRLAEAIAPIRGMLLADELNRGRFKQTEKVFDRILADGRNPGEVLFYKGELYRRRGKDGDEASALGFYHQACESVDAPADAFRSVGLMRWRRGEKDQAREYFRRYLVVKPDAGDREMIKTYLTGA